MWHACRPIVNMFTVYRGLSIRYRGGHACMYTIIIAYIDHVNVILPIDLPREWSGWN